MNSIQVTFPSKQTYRTLAALIWVSWSYTSLRDRGINNSIPLSALTIVTIIVTFTTWPWISSLVTKESHVKYFFQFEDHILFNKLTQCYLEANIIRGCKIAFKSLLPNRMNSIYQIGCKLPFRWKSIIYFQLHLTKPYKMRWSWIFQWVICCI